MENDHSDSTASARETAAGGVVDSRAVRVLLIGQSSQCFVHSVRRLEAHGCQWSLAASVDDALGLLASERFSVLLAHAGPDKGALTSLSNAIAGQPASFFYAHRVESGCWWLPVVLRGEPCLGAPALRPAEFAKLLDALVVEACSALAEHEPSHEKAGVGRQEGMAEWHGFAHSREAVAPWKSAARDQPNARREHDPVLQFRPVLTEKRRRAKTGAFLGAEWRGVREQMTHPALLILLLTSGFVFLAIHHAHIFQPPAIHLAVLGLAFVFLVRYPARAIWPGRNRTAQRPVAKESPDES